MHTKAGLEKFDTIVRIVSRYSHTSEYVNYEGACHNTALSIKQP